ncbi:aromatic-ring-hydroxylating dioxygenase subunit beta [Bacillus sp. Marseille-P3661]|uniref:aromatic-ring-hydroxylating dioxygenase subunit beta n=1 Tax=Bacillus sp. Marseille-P3661 TaxID=1936234 RepID=UPI000C82AC6C|nr:aromatic-ring-hydroxylating dioxygenase subunit beta [Bacillus sp. Marseille-P3661]
METQVVNREVTRAEIEEFLYDEAALLDDWSLEEWQKLLTDDAHYYVPSNDVPDGDPKDTLFLIADNYDRIKNRVRRLLSRHAHAENPRSKTKRFISNVRITGRSGDYVQAEANFVVYRFRRNTPFREYVGTYKYKLKVEQDGLKIAERSAILSWEELGALGNVSILL